MRKETAAVTEPALPGQEQRGLSALRPILDFRIAAGIGQTRNWGRNCCGPLRDRCGMISLEPQEQRLGN